jgi:DNA polymerase
VALLADGAPATADEVRRVLELRQEMSKTSVDKYHAMDRSMCADHRARGLLQYCGAYPTWRWAGRLIQIQNLPQNKIPDLAMAREILRSGDFELIELLYAQLPFILSQLIRTAFIPSNNNRFVVSDFSAIEARVIAWLADEQWVLDVFKGHGKIYEATAANMYGVPFDTIVRGHPNYELRARGKVATLACGFQGGANALAAMDSKKEIDPDDYPILVQKWREANPNIKQLWFDVERAAVTAVKEKTTVKVAHGVAYRYEANMLFADLPSGRSLAYVNPRIKADPSFNKDGLIFDGMDQIKKKWMSHRTYGGRLVENLVQAIARDCLAESLMRLDRHGYDIVMHVHDEVVLEVLDVVGFSELGNVTKIMGAPIDWAPGLPLSAAGFECSFYQKD